MKLKNVRAFVRGKVRYAMEHCCATSYRIYRSDVVYNSIISVFLSRIFLIGLITAYKGGGREGERGIFGVDGIWNTLLKLRGLVESATPEYPL